MGLPREAAKPVWTLTILIVIAWIVELCGLVTLQWSCDDHERKDWYSYAQLPHAHACSKILRYLHWTTWLEFPLLVAVITALIGWLGASYNTLNRYRMALIGLFAVATALQMWAANVTLNLADSDATAFLSQTELTRARITLAGYCATSAFNVLLIIALGDDGEQAAYEVLPPEPRSEPLASDLEQRVTTPHTALLSACLMPSTAGGCLSGSSTPSHSSASSRSSSASGSSMEERIRRAHSDPPLNLVHVVYVEPLTL